MDDHAHFAHPLIARAGAGQRGKVIQVLGIRKASAAEDRSQCVASLGSQDSTGRVEKVGYVKDEFRCQLKERERGRLPLLLWLHLLRLGVLCGMEPCSRSFKELHPRWILDALYGIDVNGENFI